jgi:uncharacterized protein
VPPRRTDSVASPWGVLGRGALASASMVLAVVAPTAGAQTPPFRYPRDTVVFVNGDVHLSGAVFKPHGLGPLPAVVMLHGAGPATYDEPAFRIHANQFLDQGFAVLLYDKRGSGKSTGDLNLADYEDLAQDALAGVRLLRARSDIAPDKIGVIGRSEGGWVASLAAWHDSTIAFVIMSSGSGVGPAEEVSYWTRGALRAHGAPDSVAKRALALKAATRDYYRSVARDSIAGRSAASVALHDSLAAQLASFDHYRPEVPAGLANPVKTPIAYFRAFTNMVFYDPAPAFNGMRAPLLELVGDSDDVVDPTTTITALERLRKTGHDVTIRTYPGVGHPLAILTPQGWRYPDGYLEFLTQWARERVDRVRPKK